MPFLPSAEFLHVLGVFKLFLKFGVLWYLFSILSLTEKFLFYYNLDVLIFSSFSDIYGSFILINYVDDLVDIVDLVESYLFLLEESFYDECD